MGVVSGFAPTRAPSAACSISVSGCLAVAMESLGGRLHGFDAVPGCHDRLDELPVRVAVALVDEVADGRPPVGRLIVGPSEVEGPNRIVIRPHDEDAGKTGGRRGVGIMYRRRLHPLEHFTHPTTKVQGPWAEAV